MREDAQVLIELVKQEKDAFTKAKLIEELKNKSVAIKDIAKNLGLKESYVCHLLRLNKLPPLVVDGYYTGTISLSHLFVISRLKNEDDMTALYEKVLKENLTVARTEETVREKLYNVKDAGEHLSGDEKKELEEKLAHANMKVRVIQTRVKGKILFELKGNLSETSAAIRHLSSLLKV